MKSKNLRGKLSRVDIQVSILTAALVAASVLATFVLQYRLTYRDMIETLQERVRSLYSFVEDQLDKETFSRITCYEDRLDPAYLQMKGLLERVRSSTGVRYLYTAAQLPDGSLIYVVDGLDDSSADFRNPGDPIEPEIVADMLRALEGEEIMPDQIMDTSWGHIFICYLPIHEGDKIVGVLGIEFEAGRQYQTFRALRLSAVGLVAVTCFLSVIIAVKLFKRISNPNFRDLANTDFLTGLKSRNAFETDMKNLIASKRQEGCALSSIDLDGLKKINDTEGHAAGDDYIRAAAVTLARAVGKTGTLYRAGGDEFAILQREADAAAVTALVERIAQEAQRQPGVRPSFSIGCALFDPASDRDLYDAFRRADRRMYEQKDEKKRRAGTPPLPR